MKAFDERLKEALRTGPLEEAVSAVFVRELGWQRVDGALAECGGTRVVAGQDETPGTVSVTSVGDTDSCDFVWRDRGTTFRLRIDRAAPSAYVIERLASLKKELVVREGKRQEPGREVADCFDPRRLAESFLADYRALFEKYVDRIEVLTGGKSKAPMPQQQDRQLFLNRFLTRVLLVAFLQEKGWFRFNGSARYLQELYASWKSDPGPYLFSQRLAPLFYSALNQPSQEARAMLKAQVGDVPFIGGGLFAPETFEHDLEAEGGYGIVPDEMCHDLLGEGGLLLKYDFTVLESGPNETIVAVSPEVLGAVLGAFASGERSPAFDNTASHRRACREVIADHLGVGAELAVPADPAALETWRAKLAGIHVFDDPCGSGSYLVSMLEELCGLALSVEPGSDRRAIKRRLLEENLRGLDTNEMAVQVARLRLALAVLADDGPEGPLPLPDLRKVVKKGGALIQDRDDARPVEDERTEFKAAFEWDPRKMARNPDIRFASLKTVAAFLNSQGGTLFLGLDDSGAPVGIREDLALIDDDNPEDVFQNRFREFLKNSLDPMPLSNVASRFQDFESRRVCVIDVRPFHGVTYLVYKDRSGQDREGVFVRDGNRTIELKGRARDQFVVARS